MAKSVQNLDVKIVLSKCEFIGLATFESTYIVGYMEISVLTCICLHLQKLFAKMHYFQSTLQAELNTLKESSTFKGKCS